MDTSLTKALAVAFGSILFALPQAIMVAFGTSLVVVANEPISYRYFHVLRQLSGEGAEIWLPQGQLTSLLYRLVMLLIPRPISSSDAGSIFANMEAVGIGYGFTVVALICVLLLTAAFSWRLTTRDLAIIAAVPLAMVVIPSSGLTYATGVDYQHSNMVLFAGAVAVFAYCKAALGRPGAHGRSQLLGILVGLCTANKVSMIVICIPAGVLLALDFFERRDWRGLVVAVLTSVAIAVAIPLVILLALSNFNPRVALHVLANIIGYARAPGTPEPEFFQQLLAQLPFYRPLIILLVFTMTVALMLFARFTWRRAVLAGSLTLSAALFLAALFHRPAGSTAFDVACALLALTAMAAILIPQNWLSLGRASVLIGAVLLAAVATLDRTIFNVMRASSVQNRIRMDAWRHAASSQSPIVAIVPDNRWAYGWAPISLIKGLSRFPSWEVDPERGTIAGLTQPFYVRSLQSAHSPAEPYPANATLIWEEVPSLPSVVDTYSELRAAAESRDCRTWLETGRIMVCTRMNSR
jgi:hypothetical protein